MNIRIMENIGKYSGYVSQDMVAKNAENKSVCFSVYPLCECPEDAIIGRSLISCSEIADAMKFAYDAGKAGELFVIEVLSEKKENSEYK